MSKTIKVNVTDFASLAKAMDSIPNDLVETGTFYETHCAQGTYCNKTQMNRLDYKSLLTKYIAFVEEVEGSNFIHFANDDHFTSEEIEELQRLK